MNWGMEWQPEEIEELVRDFRVEINDSEFARWRDDVPIEFAPRPYDQDREDSDGIV